MAIWHGKSKMFSMEIYRPENYGYGDWEDVECGWQYCTTSDTFRPYSKLKDGEKIWGDVLPKEGARSLLYGLAEWYNNYEGSEKLDEIIKEIRNK